MRTGTSAAAFAIRYLESISPTVRKSICKIELFEQHKAVALPECHARGLIVYSNENPNLRITRIASLWTSAMLSPYENPRHVHAWEYSAGQAVNDATDWISEATALRTLGMPDQCFTLLLDGSLLPEQSSKLFQALTDFCTVHTAMDIRFADSLQSIKRWIERRKGPEYVETLFSYHDGLLEMLQSIKAGNSVVRCNFQINAEFDTKKILEERADWTWSQWRTEWYEEHLRWIRV